MSTYSTFNYTFTVFNNCCDALFLLFSFFPTHSCDFAAFTLDACFISRYFTDGLYSLLLLFTLDVQALPFVFMERLPAGTVPRTTLWSNKQHNQATSPARVFHSRANPRGRGNWRFMALTGTSLYRPQSLSVLTVCCILSVCQLLCACMFASLAESSCYVWTVNSVGWVKNETLKSSPSVFVAQQEVQIWRFGVQLFCPHDHSWRKHTNALVSLQEEQHLSVEEENITGAPGAYSDSLLVLLLCLLLLLPLSSLQSLKWTSLPYQLQTLSYKYHVRCLAPHRATYTPTILAVVMTAERITDKLSDCVFRLIVFDLNTHFDFKIFRYFYWNQRITNHESKNGLLSVGLD